MATSSRKQVSASGGVRELRRRRGEVALEDEGNGSGDRFGVRSGNNFCRYFQDKENSKNQTTQATQLNPRPQTTSNKRNFQQQQHFHGSQGSQTTTTSGRNKQDAETNDATAINYIGQRASATLQTLLVLAADDARQHNKSIVRLNVAAGAGGQQQRQKLCYATPSSASSSSASSRCGGGGGGGGGGSGQSMGAAECSSSGFSSEASSSSVSVRTRLLEDLNRLERLAATPDFRFQVATKSQTESVSPVESVASSRMPFNSLSAQPNGAPEFDYSTLCRDEFSSFIPYDAAPIVHHQQHTKSRTPKQRRSRETKHKHLPHQHHQHHQHVGGPVLVGVHECDTPTRDVDSSSSAASSSPSALESSSSAACSLSPVAADFVRPLHDDQLSSGQSSSSPVKQVSDEDEEVRDRELVVCHRSRDDVRNGARQPHEEDEDHEAQVEEFFSDETDDDDDDDDNYQISNDNKCTTTTYEKAHESYVEPPVQLAQLCGPPEEQRQMSHTLDVYLKRVESLLRLAQGDKSVSWRHLEPEPQIKVSAEFLTPIEFVDFKGSHVRRPRVVQEIETTNLEENERESRVVFRYVHELCDFRSSMASTEHTSASLNWWPEEVDKQRAESSAQVTIDRARLEELFLSSWTSGAGEPAANSQERQLLVNTIRRHLNEFLQSYRDYQAQLGTRAEYATDWHVNWQFASASSRKRSAGEEQNSVEAASVKRFKVAQSPELLSYATLIMARYKPVKLTTCQIGLESNEPVDELNAVYELRHTEEAQELSWNAGGGARFDAELKPVDVCRLLLNDSFACQSEEAEPARDSPTRRPLEVSYESSLNNAGSDELMRAHLKFSSHGHVFELRRLPGAKQSRRKQRQLDTIKLQLLERLRVACCSPCIAHTSPPVTSSSERVKFVLPIESVELSRALPVIQFRAKFAGALPIRCAWFRSTESGQEADLLHEDFAASTDHTWPLTMGAHFDFRRGKFRFRRARNELLLDLVGPSVEYDFNRKYKCVIQNYCSRAECEFELRHCAAVSPPPSPPKVAKLKSPTERVADRKLREFAKLTHRGYEDEAQDAGQAILRTWSQRTLKRPPVIGGGDSVEVESTISDTVQSKLLPFHTQHSTVGRLSSLSALDEDKFGINYPYHPECLRRRLEENKSCLTLRSGTIKRYLRSSEMSQSDAMQQQQRSSSSKLQFEELRVEDEQRDAQEEQVTFMRPPPVPSPGVEVAQDEQDKDEDEQWRDLKPRPRQRLTWSVNQQVEGTRLNSCNNLAPANTNQQRPTSRLSNTQAKPSLPPKISHHPQRPASPISTTTTGNSHFRSTNDHESNHQASERRSSSAVRSLISRFNSNNN